MGAEGFVGVSIRTVLFAADLSVILNVAAGEWVSFVSGKSIKEKELLNEELDRETGD